ncbi:hypothetical protein [Pseudomonas baetica]|jgi:hypothetical protein|uniref:hypothetical protein n=1 Tax=Pseudomonas baetica TaxID=674054 RepID=UPI002405327F|nr:hypothetical protein [Pseudomonas baetica]MDF9778872.1 hypothetical protein [Pseudomonas baetica]
MAASIPLTPTSEKGIKAFFEGLCAIVETIEQGAPAEAGIAISPSMLELLKHFCESDPRFGRVVANLYVVPRIDMKKCTQRDYSGGIKAS